MSLHLLNRAAVAVTAAGLLSTFVSDLSNSEIQIKVLGVTITLTTLGNISPTAPTTAISATCLGSTQNANVTLAMFETIAEGDYTITATLIDVLNYAGGGYQFYQTFQPGSTINIQVDWYGAGTNRINLNVVAPALLADCPILNQYFDGYARLSKTSELAAFDKTVSATGALTGAGIGTLTWGHNQIDVYTQQDIDIPADLSQRWTLDHTAGARCRLEHMAFTRAWAPDRSSGGQAECETANTRLTGFDLEGTLYANDIPYPDSMRVIASYYKSTIATQDLFTLTANPTFTLSDSQAGYRFDNYAKHNTNPLLVAGMGSGEKPAIDTFSVTLDKTRLQELGELFYSRTGEFVCAIYGWKYDAYQLAHSSTLTIEDCGAVDPADGIWEQDVYDGSQTNIIGISGGTIELDARFIPAGQGSVFRKWDLNKAKPGHAHRFMRIRFRVIAGSLSIPFETWTMLAISGFRTTYQDAFCWRAWTLTGSAPNTWTEQVIDLCSPDSFGYWSRDAVTFEISRTVSPLPAADPTDSVFPLWGAEDSPYWGVTYFDRFRIDPEAGQRLEFDYFRTERNNVPTLGMFGGIGGQGHGYFSTGGGATFVRPALRANCDEKVSLELWDHDLINARTISQMMAEVAQEYPVAGSPARWLGWTATVMGAYPAFPSNSFLSDSSPAQWFGGGGLTYDGATWTPFKEVGAGTLPAQALGISVTWYPGAGDVFEWAGGARGALIELRAAHIMGALVGGIVFDSSGASASGITVETRKVSDNSLAGDDATDSDGEYITDSPYMKGDDNYKVAPTSPAGHEGANKIALSNFRHRVAFRAASEGAENPWNLQDELGQYHRAAVVDGKVHYWRSNHGVPLPSWAVDVDATAGPSDSEPRMIVDHLGLIRLVFVRSGSAYETRSDDDGLTWGTPAVAIANGTHPTIASGDDGEIVRAAYVAANIRGNVQYPGDTAVSALHTFLDDAGAALVVTDDTFHFQQAKEGPARWLLTIRIQGESDVSDWWSADLIRWKRIT